jgi:hypothetical protein
MDDVGIFCGHLVYIFYGHLVYFMIIWHILWSFGIFYGHLVYFMVIWYILWSFGIFYGRLVYIFSRFGVFYLGNLATLGPYIVRCNCSAKVLFLIFLGHCL